METVTVLRVFSAWMMIAAALHRADGACTMPGVFQNQKFDDSNKGTLQFTTWKLSGWSFSVKNQVVDDWEVVDNVRFTEEGYLALRSLDTFDVTEGGASVTYHSFVCLKFTLLPGGNSFQYYELHDRNQLADNERVLTSTSDGLTEFEDICNENYVYPKMEFRIMAKEGNGVGSRVTCPNAVLGNFDYKITDTNGDTFCENTEDELVVCEDKTTMTFNASACDKSLAYSAGGEVVCIHSEQENDVTYTMVYNKDDTVDDVTTFRYACFASGPDNSEATVVPGGCMSGQVPTQFAKNKYGDNFGLKITSEVKETCHIPTDTEESKKNIPLIIGLSVGGFVLLLIIIAIIIFCCCIKGRRN